MQQLVYTLRLDMKDTGIINTGLRLKQGDSGMKIVVNVYNGGQNAFDAGSTPKIVFRRPDGASVQADMTVEASSYSYVLVGNELQVPGKELMDVKFTINSDDRESTITCCFDVVADTITPNTGGSGIYDNDLAVLVDQANTDASNAIVAAADAEDSAEDSEAWAVGERNGVPVTSDDPTYENNAKYWSQQTSTLNGLSDVTITTPTDGQALLYDANSSEWVNASLATVATTGDYSDLSNKPTIPTVDQVYDGTSANAQSGVAVAEAVAPKMSYADNGVLGAKNLLPNTATTQTLNGITFTVNNDGSVTASGIASADIDFVIYSTVNKELTNETYYLNGCPNTNGCELVTSVRTISPDAYVRNDIDSGSGVSTTLTSNQYIQRVYIHIDNGTDLTTSATFYSMLRLASDTDDTYQPYAMTNRELTKTVDNISLNTLPDISITSPSNGQTLIYNSNSSKWVNGAGAGAPPYISMGYITSTSGQEACGKAFDALTTYDRPVIVDFIYLGYWMGMIFKYTNGQYGMGIFKNYSSTDLIVLSVNNGTKTYDVK